MVEPPYLVPDAENTGYTEVLLDICVKEATKIVVPQTTREVEVLSRAKSSFAALGNSVMVSDEHPIEVANDNCRLLDFCKSLDIPCPLTEWVVPERSWWRRHGTRGIRHLVPPCKGSHWSSHLLILLN